MQNTLELHVFSETGDSVGILINNDSGIIFSSGFDNALQLGIAKGLTQGFPIVYDREEGEIVKKNVVPDIGTRIPVIKKYLESQGFKVLMQDPEMRDALRGLLEKESSHEATEILKRLDTLSYLEQTFILKQLLLK